MGCKHGMNYVIDLLTDIPKGEHYVIVKTRKIFIPGDERSKTNPGHGYPQRIETCIEMRVTKSRLCWENAIKEELESEPGDFVAYHVPKVASAKLKTVVDIEG